jgi:uncharacterized protein (DUF1015 family)
MNKELVNRFAQIGVMIPEVLLPADGIDMSKWSVVACDQYTSQYEYWAEVERFVGESPSTLHLIFPEIYLEQENEEKRFEKIAGAMKKYIDEGLLIPHRPGFVLVDRKTSHSESRKGLIIAVDLEKYDYTKGSQTLIRATEGTVIERLPPRIKIRENASIELPHIMLLIDDPDRTVIEPVSAKVDSLKMLYDCELMMGGEHIRGYSVDDDQLISAILEALEQLALPSSFRSRYGLDCDKGVLLFAVGDGNHSLASAKAYWENLKATLSDNEKECHPARYALVEVVNVHDEGLKFEPIHRVLFDVNVDSVLDKAVSYFEASGSRILCVESESKECFTSKACTDGKVGNAHVIPFVSGKKSGTLIIQEPKHTLEVGTLQAFLDEFLKDNNAAKIDYIHGKDVVEGLGAKDRNMGFFLPPMDKRDLFRTVILEGALPRKTFSMGEAEEKRFYLECRKIRTMI